MPSNIKPLNMIQCTGVVSYKNYSERNKRLFIVLRLVIPKNSRVEISGEDRYNRDFPSFTFEGDQAVELNQKIDRGSRVTIIGHVETVQMMKYLGRSLFRQVYEPTLIAEQVITDVSGMNTNSVMLSGEVVRVYKNAEPGKRFYIITISVPGSDGDVRASFIYFDRDMLLEPEVKDMIHVNGYIRTKRMEPEDGSTRPTVSTSIIARDVSIERAEGHVAPERPQRPQRTNQGPEEPEEITMAVSEVELGDDEEEL